MAISFYNAGDNAIYDSGQHFVPQEKYRLGYTPPATPEPLTNMPVNGGITNTKAFNNSGGGNFKSDNNFSNNINVGGFRTPGTGENGKYQSPSGSYVTNMTSFGNMIPGLEKEDNYLQKILKTTGRGIMGMIPGAGMALSFADKLDRFDDLNPLDQEFVRMQMSQQEQNIHGTQNLPQQDRYGYNKRSALGNYSELIDKRVKIAEDFFKKNEYYRPIDQYYLDKSQDKVTLKNQIDMNDKVRNHVINQKAQNGPDINNPYSKEYSGNTQSSNYTPTGPNQPDPTPTNNNNRRDTSNNTNSNPSTPGAQDSFSNKSGKGRTGYFFGGRVNYKVGGRTDAESQYGADSAGSYDSSQNQSGREQSYGGDNNTPVSNYDYSQLIDRYKEKPDYALKDIELNKNLTSNTRLNTILNLQKTVEDKELAGQLELDKRLGPVDTRLTYGTDQKPKLSASYMNYSPTLGGIYANADSSDGLDVNYAYNNIGANANFDNSGKFERAGITYDNNGVALGLDTQDGVTASYSKDIFDGTGQIKAGGRYDPITGEYNAEGKISFPFANGGLASIL